MSSAEPTDENSNSERKLSFIRKLSFGRKRSKSKDEDEGIKTVSDIIGDWGPYQSRLFILYCMIYIIAPTQNVGIVFYTDRVDYWCKSPAGFDRNGSQCVQSIDGANITCTEWEYDHSYYERNIIQEFDLVCDRSIYVSWTKSIYQLGYLISSIFFGWFSDRYGRRLALRASILLELSMNFAQTFAPNIEIFLLARLFLGIAAYSRFLTGMLILIEWAAPKNRARVQIFSEFAWTFGKFVLPALYYFVSGNYRSCQMVIFVWELIMLYPTWVYYPDSANWLILKGRNEDVEKLLIHASEINKTGDKDYVIENLEKLKRKIMREEKEREAESNKTIFDLFKVPRLLMFSLIIYFMWFSVAFIVYGLGFNLGDLGTSLYVTYLLFELMSLVKKLLIISIINMFDRRTLMSTCLAWTAISFAAMVPFATGDAYKTLRLAFAVIGRFGISSCFDLNYLMTAEIFPTGMRQIGIGTGSVAARFASITAPFTSELTKLTSFEFTIGLYSALATAAACLVWLLPKTKDKPIPNTLEEAERRKKKPLKAASEPLATDHNLAGLD